MSTFLYRLGRLSFRRRKLVALVWLGLLVAAITGAVTLSGPTSEEFRVPGTESQKANDLLAERFPQAAADGATARVVFAAPKGEKLTDGPEARAAIDETVATLKSAPHVAKVEYASDLVSKDGRITFAQVSYKVPAGDLTEKDRDALKAAPDPARDAGLKVEMGGDAIKPQGSGLTEMIGVVVAAVTLIIAFGSLVAAGLPLLLAFVGLGISVCGIYAATGFIDLTEDAMVLAIMIGLALAIDYSLFVMFRYRHEVRSGRTPEEAIGHAVGTAGTAVVFAGLTVIIALCGLSVVQLPPLTQIALSAAVSVAITVCVALTLLPAVLGFAGKRAIAGRRAGARANKAEQKAATGNTAQETARDKDQTLPGGTLFSFTPPLGKRFGNLIARRPLPILLVTLVGLAVVAIPAFSMRLGLPDEGTEPAHTTQREAYDLLSDGFGPGFNGPLLVAIDSPEGTDAKSVADRMYKDVKGLEHVAAVDRAVVNEAGDTALLTVVPTSGPTTESTNDLVNAIRDKGSAVQDETGADVAVTGKTALNIDMSKKLSDALMPYLILVVGLAFLLLMIVFRSVLIPLTAALGFLLSVGATFGAVVAVFQWGWLTDVLGMSSLGVTVNLLPIFMIGVVFGLAMDYQVFLVTRMREEYVHGAGTKESVVAGFSYNARVVTAAAVIMMSVFGGFTLAESTMVQAVGYALAAAVFFDAFVVRMAMLPAVMCLLGRAGWWLPGPLQRLLPDVDVEGRELRKLEQPPQQPVHAEPAVTSPGGGRE
ncbi:MMPL family transporter [Streptomyces sp. NPDC055099]